MINKNVELMNSEYMSFESWVLFCSLIVVYVFYICFKNEQFKDLYL